MTSDATDVSSAASGAAAEAVTAAQTEALRLLTARTGYVITQDGGQRRYAPEDDSQVQQGAELFVGKIPRDMLEDELVPVLERAGQVLELRIMMETPQLNRGYGFVTYASAVEADIALRTLNNVEVRPNR